MGYTVVRVLQRFGRVERMKKEGLGGGGEGKPRMKCEVVMSPADGVWVGFWDAEGKGQKKA